jgi:hypothetical protein
LSKVARDWIRVEYLGEGETAPSSITTLSQVVLEIKNDSDTDRLKDVELRFRIPRARVLKVWWDTAPDYVVEESKLSFYVVEEPFNEEGVPLHSHWEVAVWLGQLKSFEKYREDVIIGILADGDLETIEMPPQGSRADVPVDQVWTAKYVNHREYQQLREERRKPVQVLIEPVGVFIFAVFVAIAFGWVPFKVIVPFEADWRSLVSYVYGFVFAGLFGAASQRLYFRRAIREYRDPSAEI